MNQPHEAAQKHSEVTNLQRTAAVAAMVLSFTAVANANPNNLQTDEPQADSPAVSQALPESDNLLHPNLLTTPPTGSHDAAPKIPKTTTVETVSPTAIHTATHHKSKTIHTSATPPKSPIITVVTKTKPPVARPVATPKPVTKLPVLLPPPIETAPPPKPGETDDNPVNTPIERLNMHPETLTVPDDIKAIMKENVVHIPELGCSGFLVRNPAGETIGVRTAQHCSLLQKDGHWRNDKSGTSFEFYSPIKVTRGEDFANETTVDTISSFIVNAATDNTKDNAFGVFGKNNPLDVLNNANQLTVSGIKALKTGDVIYNSGYPVYQKNVAGAPRRQDFAMHVLGTVKWQITNGESLNILLAAVPLSKDGAECSPGNSGSEAFIKKADGTVGIIGTASAYNDFGYLYNQSNPNNGAAVRQAAEAQFNVDLSGYSALCGFSYELPTEADGMVIGPVTSPPEVISTDPNQAIYDKFYEDYFKPEFKHHVVDGLVEVSVGKGSYYIYRPEVFYDKPSGKYVLGTFFSDIKSNLFLTVFDSLDDLKVYSHDELTPPTVTDFDGTIRSNGTDAFVSDTGLVFDKFVGQLKPPAGQVYGLVLSEGVPIIAPQK